MPFSGGVRSCLGRRFVVCLTHTVAVHSLIGMDSRFAELETIVAITMLLQHYKIAVKEEPQFAGETFEQRKERVLKAKPGITLTSVVTSCFRLVLLLKCSVHRPVKVPLVFMKRD